MPFNCSAVARELVESQLFGHRRGAFTGAVDAFPGVVRAAERGTLFLDEIGDLEPAVQPKLLRFLESGEIQPVGDVAPAIRSRVRIVAATNTNLESLAEQGRFRRDLFYRIGVARIELPPLRERKDEIPAFASLFLTRCAAECGRNGLRLGDDFIAALLLYDWPGNIRQLANEIRRVGGHGHRRADARRRRSRAGSHGQLERAADRAGAFRGAGRRNPPGSATGAGRRRARAEVHRARAVRIERARGRRGASCSACRERDCS